MHYFHGIGWGYGMGLSWLLGLILLIVFIWFIFRIGSTGSYHHHYRHPGGKSALDILNERYAKGEISKEEFQEKKKDILD